MTQNNSYSEGLAHAIEVLKNAKRVLIMGHVFTDGDSLASQLALKLILERLGINTTIWNEMKIPKSYHFLPAMQHVILTPDAKEINFDAVVFIDCPTLDRVGRNFKNKVDRAHPLINIDHHISNNFYGDINLVCKSACACGEIVFDIMQGLQVELNVDIAKCLYTSIMTDTARFSNWNTTARAHELSALLIKQDIHPEEIARNIYGQISMAQLQLFRKSLKTIELDFRGQVCWMTIPKEFYNESKAVVENSESFIDYIKQIDGVKVAVLLNELPCGEIRISFRSNDKQYPVDQLAQALGGGGHLMSSGTLLNMDLGPAKEKVLNEMNRILSFHA